ncbi:MAG: preprotein translocase subunit SecA [Planctomycetota bacterium]
MIESVGRLVKGIFGTRNERVIKGNLPVIDQINALEAEFESYSDDQLRAKTDEFKARLKKGETLDDLLPEAFATAREAAKRTLGQRLYDVQLMGGIGLHNGAIAEMMTGEGKTLTSVAPAYLNAITGRGVHIVTVNDYLARRDAQWNQPVYELLGLTVGCIQSRMHSAERIPQYGADITYGTNSEFGFDYLRDNMKTRMEDQCQRDRHFAIIDEVDSILIDEARTPLIISGPAEEATDKYYRSDRVVRRWGKSKGIDKADLDDKLAELVKGPSPDKERVRLELENDYYFVFSEKQHSAYLTEQGIIAAQNDLGVPDFYAPSVMNENWPHHLEQAVRSHAIYHVDVDYVVKDGEIIIVDENTGRLMEGRRWSDGLHQAIEAKEGIKIQNENQTLATVTIQNFFRLYDKLCGMTGTALTEAAEFYKIYKLDVNVVPTNRPLRRTAFQDRVFLSEKEKFHAVLDEILRVHALGRPILVGTTSIEASERLSNLLVKRGVQHEVLNAKQHEREAHIVLNAGQFGVVSIATNMAGRGTDILLGEFTFADMLEHWKKNGAAPKDVRADADDLFDRLADFWVAKHLDEKQQKKLNGASLDAKRTALEANWKIEGVSPYPFERVSTVASLGGLHILGTERHESRRIDNQLRGRAGRQGDPGSSVFYVALEDPLMRKFAREGVKNLLAKMGMGDGQEVTSPLVSRAIQRAQKKVEERNFDIRKNLLEYDQVNDDQRKAVYGHRTAILHSEGLEETVTELSNNLIEAECMNQLDRHMAPSEWPVGDLSIWALRKFGVEISPEKLREAGDGAKAAELVQAGAAHRLQQMREEIGDEDFSQILRFVLLQSFDDKWKEHLRELDALRQSIGLRGYAQVDPKQEYKREASDMFNQMQENIAEAVTDMVYRIQISDEMSVDELDDALSGRWQPSSLTQEEASAYETEADQGPIGSAPERIEPIRRETPKVGRNDPCPCGSGKKYKKCCGKGE